MASAEKIVEALIGGAIGLFVLYALIPGIASSQSDAENASGVDSTQATLIGVVFTVFIAGAVYKVWQMMN